MSDEYIDLTLIECNRQASDTKDDSNNAVWNNTLGNTFHMMPGDKVSLYSAFINERGSGQLGSIEFKGKSMLETETSIITNSVKTQSFNASTKKFELVEENCSNISYVFLPRDNYSELTISFYKTMDLMSYVQLPRRFIPIMDTTNNYLKEDTEGFGRVFREPYELEDEQLNTFGYVVDDYFPYGDQKPAAAADEAKTIMFKLRNDNSRMTIFKQHRTIFDISKTQTYKIPFTVTRHDNASGVGFENFFFIKLILPFPYNLHHKIIGTFSYNTLDHRILTDKIASPLFVIESNVYMHDRGTLTNDPVGFNRRNFFRIIEDAGNNTYKVFVSAGLVGLIPKDTVLHLIPNDNNFPPYYANEPEYISYVRYRKNIPLEVPQGYNSAQFVSNELSRQLQRTTDIKTEEIYHPFRNANHTKFSVTKDYDSNTYELFNATNETIFTEAIYDTVYKDNINAVVEPANASITGDPRFEYTATFNASTASYYKQFQYVGIKRPEIYETGIQLNSIFGLELNNYITETTTQAKSKTEPIRIKLEYNRENCIKIKNFVEAQSNYPELFSRENIYNLAKPADNVFTNGSNEPLINIDNARFLHINQLAANYGNNVRPNDINIATIVNGSSVAVDSITWPTMLGSSYYGTTGYTTMNGSTPNVRNRQQDSFAQSIPFFFKYDISQKDEFYEHFNHRAGYLANYDIGELTFGCIGRDGDFIVLFPNKLLDGNGSGIGLPSQLFDPTFLGGPLHRFHKLGFDHHFNAWGTAAIMLHCGFASKTEQDKIQFNNVMSNPFTNDTSPNDYEQMKTGVVSKVYLGAPKAQIEHSDGRFGFKLLHNVLNKGYFNASVGSDDPNDAALDVYKINPRQEYSNLTPTQMPYAVFDTLGSIPNQTTQSANQNQEQYAIYDSYSGIFIEDFNIKSENWDQSLFNTLGFTYEQLHGQSVRNDRIDENNRSSLSIITTNADIGAINTKSWNINFYGSPMFDDQIGRNIGSNDVKRTLLPEIVQPCIGVSILATNYPININRGYYAIRSDIIPNTAFVGGKTSDSNLPVIAIASKESPQGDFFFGTESDLEFMITKPTVLSSVRVSIHDPDGSYSNVSPNSSVVFKIQRLRKVSFNIAQEIQQKLAEEHKQKTK